MPKSSNHFANFTPAATAAPCRRLIASWTIASFAVAAILSPPTCPKVSGDEPATDFLNRLRSAGYYDTAITFLSRADKMAGMDSSFLASVGLEKAQTYIDAAVASRRPSDRDKFFLDAQRELQAFVAGPTNDRQSEARLMLGKLQMIRAAQLLVGDDVDKEQRAQARESYVAASNTFSGIIEELKVKLTELRNTAIDPNKEPEKAKQRDQFQFEYLQAKLNAADSKKLAAKTFDDPGKDGKALLEESFTLFQELSKKYSRYPIGAIALMHMGQINELLGKSNVALDNYLRMLEQPDVDDLREAKFYAAAGLIRVKLADEPPSFDDAISRTNEMQRTVRPNERTSQAVQEYRLELAKAHLAKSADEKQKPADAKRAKSEARQLLMAASKIPGLHVDESKTLLAELGIDKEAEALPTAEPPKSFDDAFSITTELFATAENQSESLKLLREQPETPEIKAEIESTEKLLSDTREIAIQTIRAGLGMITEETDPQQINSARQILAYLLYYQQSHRDAAVVGGFLARTARGTPVGLDGGLIALTSLQTLVNEIPDSENDGMIRQLDGLGKFLTENWPDDPKANAVKGIRIQLMLQKDDFDNAEQLILAMPEGAERASFKRLLGQLLWNQSIKLRDSGDDKRVEQLQTKAQETLLAGLEEIEGNLVDTKGMQAALVLAKIYHHLDASAKALAVLDHKKYGPLNLIKQLGSPSNAFDSDLYNTELKVLVKRMLQVQDPSQLLDRMTKTMENLRESYDGDDGQAELTRKYKLLAQDVGDELEKAPPAKRTKLIEVFKVFLKRIASGTDDKPTLRWAGQTLMTMAEAAMLPTDKKASGQAAELLADAAESLKTLSQDDDLAANYLYTRALRLLGKYPDALNQATKLLKSSPMMLDGQIEGALIYEAWAGELPKQSHALGAYDAAVAGGREGADGRNIIWGWGEISKQAAKNPAFRDKFFEARYHVSVCFYLRGKKANDKKTMQKAKKEIERLNALYPKLGGPEQREKFDVLLKQIQKDLGERQTGLGPPPQPANPPKP